MKIVVQHRFKIETGLKHREASIHLTSKEYFLNTEKCMYLFDFLFGSCSDNSTKHEVGYKTPPSKNSHVTPTPKINLLNIESMSKHVDVDSKVVGENSMSFSFNDNNLNTNRTDNHDNNSSSIIYIILFCHFFPQIKTLLNHRTYRCFFYPNFLV